MAQQLLRPAGRGLTVVGDDCQAIYSFRSATVRNILDFSRDFPGATVVRLEQNYRSTQPLLAASNRVINQSAEWFPKELWSSRREGEAPWLVTCEDENEQTDFVVDRILAQREQGIPLRRQAVLFRASHHSLALELELNHRNIPFHKYGGLKFIETARVKDLLSFLRLTENPRDAMAGMRVLGLLPSIGPSRAKGLMEDLVESRGRFCVWRASQPPAASAEIWPQFVGLLDDLSRSGRAAASSLSLSAQIDRIRVFYQPLLELPYENAAARAMDLEQLGVLAGNYTDRAAFLAEVTLDPPSWAGDLAGPPLLDKDYLVLSTMHSAKGLEWDSVFVIHAADGNIPSDMATGSSEEIEKERRLLYVALTRAKTLAPRVRTPSLLPQAAQLS